MLLVWQAVDASLNLREPGQPRDDPYCLVLSFSGIEYSFLYLLCYIFRSRRLVHGGLTARTLAATCEVQARLQQLWSALFATPER